MEPKFAMFTKGSKFPVNKGFKNMLELLQCSTLEISGISGKYFSFFLWENTSCGYSLEAFHMKTYNMFSWRNKKNEPAHDKTYNKTCATSKDSVQLHICTVWSEFSLIACAFYSLLAIQRGINKNPCYTGWMDRLIWVFAGTGLIVGIVVRWLKYQLLVKKKKKSTLSGAVLW